MVLPYKARGHRDVIARFGRHPHCNEILGRQSTPEELEYLEKGQVRTQAPFSVPPVAISLQDLELLVNAIIDKFSVDLKTVHKNKKQTYQVSEGENKLSNNR